MDEVQLLWMDGIQIQPLGGGSLLFTIQFSEIPGTRFIDLERIKGWVNLEATQWLIIFPSYHPKQFKGKIMNKTWKNGKKPDSGPNFGAFAPNLVPKHIFVSLTSTSRYILFQANILRNLKEKLINQIWENGKKLNFNPNFDPFGQNVDHYLFLLLLLLFFCRFDLYYWLEIILRNLKEV